VASQRRAVTLQLFVRPIEARAFVGRARLQQRFEATQLLHRGIRTQRLRGERRRLRLDAGALREQPVLAPLERVICGFAFERSGM